MSVNRSDTITRKFTYKCYQFVSWTVVGIRCPDGGVAYLVVGDATGEIHAQPCTRLQPACVEKLKRLHLGFRAPRAVPGHLHLTRYEVCCV